MRRRTFLLLAPVTNLDLWRMQYEQMRRDEAQKELDRRNEAAIRFREIREALLELDKAIHADYLKVVDPYITDAPAAKRLRNAARRFAKSLE